MTPGSVVALVPMRHVSERVPGKNYRPFAGRPLYHRVVTTLLACRSVPHECRHGRTVPFPMYASLPRGEAIHHRARPLLVFLAREQMSQEEKDTRVLTFSPLRAPDSNPPTGSNI